MNPTPSASPGRNAYIDTLRGWSIFGVVTIHFAGSFVTTDVHAWSPSFWLGLAFNQGFIFAVPLFIFLSGWLAGNSRASQSLGEYYRGRFWRIGAPYLLVSLLSLFFLNHLPTLLQQPHFYAKAGWLLARLCFDGVEPTLYFIPVILQLYLLQPALKALPGWLHRLVPAVSAERFALLAALLLLALHVTLGLLCYRGTLNYYVWGRPNLLFWVFYFFAGLHFKALTGALSMGTVRAVCRGALVVAALAMAWNFFRISDRSLMGEHFERNGLDFAYVRPEMLVYDLALVAAFAAGIILGWGPRAGLASWLGRYTLEVYLWHILVLYYGAWRYPETLESCRQMPELIVIICAAAALLIAFVADRFQRLADFIRHHRIALVKVS
jgi:surface polysaccharide O-acyltransferase-like enzyme